MIYYILLNVFRHAKSLYDSHFENAIGYFLEFVKIFKGNYKIFMTFSYFSYAPFTFKKRNAKIYSTFQDKMSGVGRMIIMKERRGL